MKEKKALVGTMIFMIISIVVYWILKKIGIEGNVAYATILLIPILVYVILADKITSFKAGDIEATFKEVANSKISTGDDSIEELSNNGDLDIIAKGAVGILQERVRSIKERTNDNKIILTLKMGTGGYYSRDAVTRYIKDLFMFAKFRFVVLLDENQRVVAFISKEKISVILENQNLGQEFIRILNDGTAQELSIFPGLFLNKIKDSTKNIDALKEMDANKIDELIVVDSEDKLKGVIQREDILSKLMIALAE